MRCSLLSALCLAVLCMLAAPSAVAADNGIDTHDFTAPALVPLSDASIAVGDAVWRGQDGLVYVVQAKSVASITLVDARSPGFVRTSVTTPSEKVVKIAHLSIEVPAVPAAPTAVSSTP